MTIAAPPDIDPGIRDIRKLSFDVTEVDANGRRFVRPGMDAHHAHMRAMHLLRARWGSEEAGRTFIAGYDQHGAFTLRRLDAIATAGHAALDADGCTF